MSAPDDDIGHLGISRRAVVAGLTAVACVQWDVAMAAPDDGTLAERFVMFDPPVPLQPISLLDRNGRSATLAARPGRTRLIVLWANWCPACHQEVPALAAAQRSLARDGIDVAVVNVDATPLTGIVIRSTDVSTGTLPSFSTPMAQVCRHRLLTDGAPRSSYSGCRFFSSSTEPGWYAVT